MSAVALDLQATQGLPWAHVLDLLQQFPGGLPGDGGGRALVRRHGVQDFDPAVPGEGVDRDQDPLVRKLLPLDGELHSLPLDGQEWVELKRVRDQAYMEWVGKEARWAYKRWCAAEREVAEVVAEALNISTCPTMSTFMIRVAGPKFSSSSSGGCDFGAARSCSSGYVCATDISKIPAHAEHTAQSLVGAPKWFKIAGQKVSHVARARRLRTTRAPSSPPGHCREAHLPSNPGWARSIAHNMDGSRA